MPGCRVLANVLFPNWLITLVLLGLLLFLTYKTARKAVSLHRCEVRYLAQKEEQKALPVHGKARHDSGATSDAVKFSELICHPPMPRPHDAKRMTVASALCCMLIG